MIIVTGAAGFIGSRVAQYYARQGLQVLCVDHLDYFQSRREIPKPLAGTELLDRDLFLANLPEILKKQPIGAIFHLGACAKTTELREDYLQKVNVEYSQTIWNFCSLNQIPLLYASSAATYGDGNQGYDDNESQMMGLRPLNPYGWSKHRFDLWALHQEKLGNHPPAWSGFKFFNVYGFGERHKGSMASVVLHSFDQIQKTGASKLFRSHHPEYADGYQSRDFILVDDVIRVLDFAWKKPILRGIYNLGTGQARPFLDLSRAVFQALGKTPKIEFIDTPEHLRERYQYFTQATMEKLKNQGYTAPFTSLEEGVRLTVLELLAQIT